jgi:F420-0:gamma-glutamyl ligase
MAAAAVGLMGEGAECIPVVIIRSWPDLPFNDTAGQAGFFTPREEDIFAPLLEAFGGLGRKESVS